jgi:protein-S-isoprenylcysteine O-methyltransferase Ste14
MPETLTPLPFVWPYALLFWGVFLWSFWPEMGIMRRARQSAGATDARSVQVIMFGNGISGLAAWVLAWIRALQFPGNRVAVFMIGLAVVIAGALLRRHCFRMLGASFTGDVRASADQRVVTSGAYSLLRHPSYTAGVLMNVGTGLALGSWASTLILVVAAFAVYAYRIAVEERALLTAIGEPYREFMHTRKRLIPFIY